MNRLIFDNSNILPSTLEQMHNQQDYVIKEVSAAIENNDVVVIGMKANPHCKRACGYLKKHEVSFHYLEYGSYVAKWRKRLQLKMWLGWSTFPMVFVKGQFIGGANELNSFLQSADGEALKKAA